MYKKKICKCKARAKIFMRAFCSSRADFHMEKTAVSLPPHVSKGFERIIYQQIITYMEGKLLKCLTVFRNSYVIQHLLVTMLGKRKKNSWQRRMCFRRSLRSLWHNQSWPFTSTTKGLQIFTECTKINV